jgi:hypothetical protein
MKSSSVSSSGSPGFSPLHLATVRAPSLPLYRWQVIRRDRAVASGTAAGRLPVLGPRRRTRAPCWHGSAARAGSGRGWTEPRTERHEA